MVYIDDFNVNYGRMIMCHMIADTTEELVKMAEAVGVRHKWIQDRGTKYEHFDICLSSKKKALALGAKEVQFRLMARLREARETCNSTIVVDLPKTELF